MQLRAKPTHVVLATLPSFVRRLPQGFSRTSLLALLVSCQALSSAPARSHTAQGHLFGTGPTGT